MKYGIALFAAIFLAAACGKQQKNVVLNGFAQGSTYHIVIAQDTIAGLCHSIDSLFDRIDDIQQGLATVKNKPQPARFVRRPPELLH